MSHPLRAFMKSFGGDDPYSGFDATPYAVDLQGWGHEHPIFESVLQRLQPKDIIEVGTWKGASAIRMAKICKRLGLESTLLCVDTWLGSHPTLWTGFRADLQLQHGFPQMYFQFLANVVKMECQDVILPLPMTSFSAANWMAANGVKVDCIYLDSSHDLDESYIEVNRYFKLLRKGGIIFGDDYSQSFKGLVVSINRFASEQGLCLQTFGEKWMLVND